MTDAPHHTPCVMQAISNAVVRRFTFTNDDDDTADTDTDIPSSTTAGTTVANGNAGAGTGTGTGMTLSSGVPMMARIRPQGNGPWLDPEVFVAAAGEGD